MSATDSKRTPATNMPAASRMNSYRVLAEFGGRADRVYRVRARSRKEAATKLVQNHGAVRATVIERV